MKRRSSILSLFLASTMLCGLTAGAGAQELRHRRPYRPGRCAEVDDLSHQPAFHAHQPDSRARRRASRSSSPSSRRTTPTGRSTSSISRPTSAASMPACWSRRAPAARPIARRSTPSSSRSSSSRARWRRSTEYLHQGRNRRPLPVHQGRHHRSGRQHLCVVVEHRPSPALSQQGGRRERAAGLGRAEGGRARCGVEGQGRRPLQWRPLGRHHLRLARAVLGAGRQADRRQRQADLRRRRGPREDAEGAGLLQGSRRQRRGAEAGCDHQGLRRLQRGGDRRHGGDVHRRPLAELPAQGSDAGGSVRQVGSLGHSRPDRRRALDRHRRLDPCRAQQGPGEDQALHGPRSARSIWVPPTTS